MFIDRDGHPMTTLEWAAKFEDFAYRCIRIQEIRLPGEEWAKVSTVWLGIAPLIFETMVFGYGDDEYQERYATEAEAREGHERAIEWVCSTSARNARLRESRPVVLPDTPNTPSGGKSD